MRSIGSSPSGTVVGAVFAVLSGLLSTALVPSRDAGDLRGHPRQPRTASRSAP